MLKVIFFALQAFLISYKSFFNIEIIDKEIQTITLISSVSILNIFNGLHNSFIVSAIPSNGGCIRIYNCDMTYYNKLYTYPKCIYESIKETINNKSK